MDRSDVCRRKRERETIEFNHGAKSKTAFPVSAGREIIKGVGAAQVALAVVVVGGG